jgi:hypothetical protein
MHPEFVWVTLELLHELWRQGSDEFESRFVRSEKAAKPS